MQQRSTSSKSRKDIRGRMEMVPWGGGKKKSKPKSLGIREKLEDLAKQGQSAYKDVYRRAKVRYTYTVVYITCTLSWATIVDSTMFLEWT